MFHRPTSGVLAMVLAGIALQPGICSDAVVGPPILFPDILVPGGTDGSNRFRRGDANGDEETDISDAVSILGCLFSGGTCPTCEDAADANDDGLVNMSDSIFLLNFLFQAGPEPPSPSSGCGSDPTNDGLGCNSSPCAMDLPAGTIWTHHKVPGSRLGELINFVAAQGGSPRWLSGYLAQGDTFYTVIFEKMQSGTTLVDFDLSPGELGQRVASRKSAGYRVRHLDSNEGDLSGRISVIFEKTSGPPQSVLHATSRQDHETRAQELVLLGYRPVNMSATEAHFLGGTFSSFTSLWEQGVIGERTLETSLSASDFQSLYDDQVARGRQLLHLDSYSLQSGPGYSAIFGPRSQLRTKVQMHHGMDTATYRSTLRDLADEGYKLQGVTGSTRNGAVSYAAFWKKEILIADPVR